MITIFFILGLIMGSFLNAIVYRLNAVESLWERSHCPHCRKKIRWHDNIPLISFLVLSARCRDCGEKISWQYPLVEFFMGIIFAAIGALFFQLFDTATWAVTAYFLIVFFLLMVIFVYDLKYMEIPMVILWIGVGAAILGALFFDWQQFNPMMGFWDLKIVSGLVGGGVAFVFFYMLAAVSKETWMGMGDAYLGLFAGLVVGWPKILVALMLAFMIGALVSVALLMLRKKTMKSQVPFAPFLVAGVLLTIILPAIFPQLAYMPFLY